MTFLYVSGAGTDSSEKGRTMWARVKGKTENALLRLPFKAAYMFRPGVVQPLHRMQSKTASYRVLYTAIGSDPPAGKVAPAAIRRHHRDSWPGHDPRRAERTPKTYP
jgi:hypothetical protein